LTGSKRIEGSIGKIFVGDSYPVKIMGVINLTSDSFYSGSVWKKLEEIRAEAVAMQDEGADLIDLGARSTAPYKEFEIPVSTEKRVLGEAVNAVADVLEIPISADTTRLEPARVALDKGALALNHVHGLTGRASEEIARMIASKECDLILVAHERGVKSNRTGSPIERVASALKKSLQFCSEFGISREKITIDPGIGFFRDAKISNIEWNCNVLANLEDLRFLDRPICVGLSRKRFLGQLIGNKPPEDRLNASTAANALSVYNGAHVIRTHDVKETREAAIVARALREKRFIR
jgi:dihydropteroate synthase